MYRPIRRSKAKAVAQDTSEEPKFQDDSPKIWPLVSRRSALQTRGSTGHIELDNCSAFNRGFQQLHNYFTLCTPYLLR